MILSSFFSFFGVLGPLVFNYLPSRKPSIVEKKNRLDKKYTSNITSTSSCPNCIIFVLAIFKKIHLFECSSEFLPSSFEPLLIRYEACSDVDTLLVELCTGTGTAVCTIVPK